MTKRSAIADRLRERIVRAIDDGTLCAGDRLPSSRALAPEFRADPRVIAAAYRELSTESLVDVRPKSGIYVAASAAGERHASLVQAKWVTEIFVDAIGRGVPLPELGPAILDFSETRRLRAAAVAETVDQAVGIGRELKHEYGLNATTHQLAEIRSSRPSSKFRSAHVIVATNHCVAEVRRISENRPVISVSARPDLFNNAEWQSLMDREVYMVVTDPGFIAKVRQVLQRAKVRAKLRMVLAGRDDLSRIPAGAPTYVTESARMVIGKTRLPGRIIRRRRLFSDTTARDIVSFIIAHNSSAT